VAKTDVKEHPILFSGPMVRAILNGTKTQTRRAITRPHIITEEEDFEYRDSWIDSEGNCCAVEDALSLCPYGQPGDALWLKENFWKDSRVDYANPPREIFYDATPEIALDHMGAIMHATYLGGEKVSREDSLRNLETNKFWSRKPSIHMPRWASRITLEVTDVRVERIHSITDEDVLREGVLLQHIEKYRKFLHPNDIHGTAFGELWDSINAKRGFPWKDNPWVWVVSFKVLEDTNRNGPEK